MKTTCALFDLGGVVIRTPFELVPSFEARRGLDPGELRLAGPFGPDLDPLWQQRERGQLREWEYWQAQAERLLARLDMTGDDPTRTLIEALYDLPEADIVRPEVVSLIAEMRADGLQVSALTNDLSRFHSPEWIDRMVIFQEFEPLIDLGKLGLRKPDAEAYDVAIAQLGLAPEALVFIDDQTDNVAGARRAGFPTIFFDPTDVPGSIERVRSLVVS